MRIEEDMGRISCDQSVGRDTLDTLGLSLSMLERDRLVPY